MSGDVMSFPDNWWTFVQDYQFVDKEEIYTNGSMLIPSFRVCQMVEHYFGGKVGKTSRYTDRTCYDVNASAREHGAHCFLWRCSNCDESYDTEMESMNYCPSCGARVIKSDQDLVQEGDA